MTSGAAAELSSIESQLLDLSRRIEAIASQFTDAERDDVHAALLETERSLRSARQHVARATRLLG